MSDQWTMRPYQPGDETAIIELFKSVFNVEITREQWVWRYLENGSDLKLIMLAETASGSIVGQYALCPVRMNIDEKEILGSFSLDTMVHKDWVGRGIFVKLANAVYRMATENDIPLTYGFPNINSYHGFVKKLGWMDLCRALPVLFRPINIERVVKSKINNKTISRLLAPPLKSWLKIKGKNMDIDPVSSYYTIKRVETFDDATNTLWKLSKGISRISLIRDAEYLNWRFVRNPVGNYCIFRAETCGEISGYIVLKFVNNFGLKTGYIVDLLTLPGQTEVANALVGTAINYFIDSDMDISACMIMKNQSYVKQLHSYGYIKIPSFLFPKDVYLGVRNNTGEFSNELLGDWRNWNISWGDHDRV